jgi:predicted unusual protein kinase regulating ubiquinone biosynthesis (AarF/ABC1/UbiB family)
VNLRAYWRFVVVAYQFLPLIIAYARDKRRFLLFGGSRDVSPEQRRKRAASLLESLLTLGPTFIKLGQLLSTRPDILPPEYIDEFTKLQDSVPPAPWDEARIVLEEDLGPVGDRFAEFDTDPISGASLGQVYYAEVDGQPVAVKIRRPGVKDLVEADLKVVRWSIPLLIRFVGDAQAFSLETLADEFDRTIRQEMDYNREARMLNEIKANFRDNDDIRIPEVVGTHSTGRVLTMEYVPGTKISNVEELDTQRLDRTELAETLQRAYLDMIVEDGVFHADPHPGNLAVQDDGTLVFYDFGMSGYVDPFIQDKIVEFYTAIAAQDIDAILDTLIEMGTLSPEADRQVMSDVMELAIADARGEDVEQYRVQQIVQQVEDTIYEFPLRLPSNLALVLRVATVVEGVCVTLDPDFDFISVATEYLNEEGYIEAGVRDFVEDRFNEGRDAVESSVRIPPKIEDALDRVEREDFHIRADLEDSEQVIERLGKRLVLGLALAAGGISTAMLYSFQPGETVAIAIAGTLTAVVGILVYRSFRKRRGIRAKPQFTRQSMRQQEHEREQEAGASGALGFGDAAVTQSQESETVDGTQSSE